MHDKRIKMLNTIIKDIFSEDEVQEIKDTISENLSQRELVVWDESNPRTDLKNISKLHSDMGRLLLQDIEFSKVIVEKLLSTLAEQGINKRYISAAYCEYAGRHGTPNLGMHRDKGPKETICLDYKLDFNTGWDLIVDGTAHDIPKNSAIVFETVGQQHGRPVKQFSADEYVRVIFFYFV